MADRQFAALLLAAAAVPVAAAPGGDELKRWCGILIEAPQSDEAALCRVYVEGYLDGARMGKRMAAGGPARTDDESLVERATRTRLTRMQLQRARGEAPDPYCIDADVRTADVVARIARDLERMPAEPALDADEAVHRALTDHFPCNR